MDRIIRADEEIGAGTMELARRLKYQIGHALPISRRDPHHIFGQSESVETYFGVRMLA